MSDRIAVMSEGELQQVGTAHEIYEHPNNRFVADFIGETNILNVTITAATGSSYTCQLPGGVVIEAEGASGHEVGGAGHISIRPERISISGPDVEVAGPAGLVEHIVYLGTDTQHLVRLDDGVLITVRTQNAHHGFVDLEPGDRAALTIDDGAARLLGD